MPGFDPDAEPEVVKAESLRGRVLPDEAEIPKKIKEKNDLRDSIIEQNQRLLQSMIERAKEAQVPIQIDEGVEQSIMLDSLIGFLFDDQERAEFEIFHHKAVGKWLRGLDKGIDDKIEEVRKAREEAEAQSTLLRGVAGVSPEAAVKAAAAANPQHLK